MLGAPTGAHGHQTLGRLTLKRDQVPRHPLDRVWTCSGPAQDLATTGSRLPQDCSVYAHIVLIIVSVISDGSTGLGDTLGQRGENVARTGEPEPGRFGRAVYDEPLGAAGPASVAFLPRELYQVGPTPFDVS